jgi:8-oxo-dGTP pyrophosphatase MutT (NUDIX family)
VRWTVHGERSLYESSWVNLRLVDVELPDGNRFEHHVVRTPYEATGAVVTDPARGVLLLWRHRFITDTWGWEIPAGHIDAGESPAEAAGREVREETGWAAGPLRHLITYNPMNGLADKRFHLFVADGATRVGEPTDANEAERIEWIAVDDVRRMARSGEVQDGLSLTALLYALAFDVLGV